MSDVDFLLCPTHMQGQVPSRGRAAQPAAERAPTRRAGCPRAPDSTAFHVCLPGWAALAALGSFSPISTEL